MIIHRRKRRWYWPFKTIYSQHTLGARISCTDCKVEELFDAIRYGKTSIGLQSMSKKHLEKMQGTQ